MPPLRWMASVLYAGVLSTGLYFRFAGLAPDWSDGALALFTTALLALLALEQFPRPSRTVMPLDLRRIRGPSRTLTMLGLRRVRRPSRTLTALGLRRIRRPSRTLTALGLRRIRRPSRTLTALCLRWIRRPSPGVGLLIVRMILLEFVNAADAAGFARALYVVVPFFAYLSLGRRAGIALAVAYLAAGVVRAAIAVPGWQTDPEVVSDLLMLAVGMLLALAAAAVADGQQRQRRRAENLVDDLRAAQLRVAELSATAERNRLARDIHDSVGHHLTAVSVQLAKAEAFRPRDAGVADRAVSDARQAASRALAEVRSSVAHLRAPEPIPPAAARKGHDPEPAPPDTSRETHGAQTAQPDTSRETHGPVTAQPDTSQETHGPATAQPDTSQETHGPATTQPDGNRERRGDGVERPGTMRELAGAVTQLGAGMDLRVAVDFAGVGAARPAGIEALHRVVQEALTNARRHADPGLVRVTIRTVGPDIVLEVADDGRGFTPEAGEGAAGGRGAGSGLVGMRERLAGLGGTVRIESAPGCGTRIVAVVPA